MHTSPKRDLTAGDFCNPLRASGKTNPFSLATAMERRLRSKGFVIVEGMGASAVGTVVKAVATANFNVWEMKKVVRGCVESMTTVARSGGGKQHPGLRIILKMEDLPDGMTGEKACAYKTPRKLKSGSCVAKVAGSIAKLIRSSSLSVGLVLTDELPATINNAVKAIALTRTMLKDNSVDVVFTAVPAQNTVCLTVLPVAGVSMLTADEFLYMSELVGKRTGGSSCGSLQDIDTASGTSTDKATTCTFTHDPYTWGDEVAPDF